MHGWKKKKSTETNQKLGGKNKSKNTLDSCDEKLPFHRDTCSSQTYRIITQFISTFTFILKYNHTGALCRDRTYEREEECDVAVCFWRAVCEEQEGVTGELVLTVAG